ncbi:MAG: hypothetical protein CL589_14825 [Alteromonadaceae bacterium]|jgi:ribosomal protein L7/L12|nr:hypothetical protein [Alteromonadaceae bacterium]MAX43883.1 hypothetical protein [Alteromonadaceae bacterium]|tara:strand:+ start:767 stop:988 length:222 start_codon:yes stop_codon:yes gene_type:complete
MYRVIYRSKSPFSKVKLDKRLKRILEIGLLEAKSTTDELLDKQTVTFESINSRQADQLLKLAVDEGIDAFKEQ